MSDRKFTNDEVMEVLDICDKLDFFYGQRAGRELWFRKPVEVQNEDIRKFADDIQKIKSFINRQDAELDKLRKAKYIFATVDYCADDLATALKENKRLKAENEEQDQANIKDLKRMGEIRAEAIKEFAERLKEKMDDLSRMEYDCKPYFLVSKSFVDKIADEMKGGEPRKDGGK